MKPRITALRAISSRFARQAIYPLLWLWAGVVVLLLAAIWLLAQMVSDWWWLAAIPVGVLGVIGVIAWLVTRLVLKALSPPLTKAQTDATDDFIDKLKRLYENASTPYPFLAARIVFEVVFKRKENLIRQTISDSRGLKGDFEQLQELFK